MSVTTASLSQVVVNLAVSSVISVSNELCRMMCMLADACGVPAADITRQDILAGLYTWLCTRHLESVHLEMVKDGSLLRRFDFSFQYRSEVDAGQGQGCQSATSTFEEFIKTLGALPEGAEARIFLRLAPGAPKVNGWSVYAPLSTDHLKLRETGASITSPCIGAKLLYWGE